MEGSWPVTQTFRVRPQSEIENRKSEINCLFCRIAHREVDAAVVFEDDFTLAFLDHKPLFEGHVLLIPKQHLETLEDLPPELLQLLFLNAQKLTSAVREAMGAEGTFVAMNNKISQSVPHFHIHIVPRRKGDGLKGFFWPRTTYASPERMEQVRAAIARAFAE